MLNNNLGSDMLTVDFTKVFLNSKRQIMRESGKGRIFTTDNFANGWDTIYVKPSDLQEGEFSKGMRMICEPTLVITTRSSKMAFVLANEKEPVYIPSSNGQKVEGYTLAFRLAPVITPEFVYYMCLYDTWSNIIKGIDRRSAFGDDGWAVVGTFIEDGCGGYEITPESVVRSYGKITIPSLARQKEFVEAGINQNKHFSSLQKASKEDVASIVNRYLALSSGIFDKGNASLGLLSKVYHLVEGDKANKKVLKILEDNNYKYEDVLQNYELEILGSNLEATFDELVKPSEFSWSASTVYLQPQEVTKFMLELAEIPEGVQVYNPFSGLGSFSIALKGNPVLGEEENAVSWALAQIHLCATNTKSDVFLRKPLAIAETTGKFQAVLSSPNFQKDNNEEIQEVISSLYDKLMPQGVLVTLVPLSFLFSTASSVLAVRTRLYEEKAFRGIFTLPSNIFPGTAMHQAVIVLTKGIKNERIVFGDATDYTRFKKSVYRMTTFECDQFLQDMKDEIEDYFERGEYVDDTTIAASILYENVNVWNLIPATYLVERPQNGIPLSDLADLVKCVEDESVEQAKYFITASSIPESMHRMPYLPKPIGEKRVSTAKAKSMLPHEAVILAITPNGIRSVYTEGFQEVIAYPSNVVMVLQPKNGISAKYLATLLSNKIVANQIKSQASGGIVATFNRIRLKDIIVPEHSSNEQRERFISESLSEEMDESAKQNAMELLRRETELKSTRHAMAQTIVSLTSNWKQLNMFADKNEGKIDLSDMIGRINPISVKELMSTIGHAIDTLRYQVDSLRLEKYDWGLDSEINPYKFINDYISSHSTPSIRMVNLGGNNECDFPWFDENTGESGEHHTTSEFVFYAPERMLERIFNDIVANAIAHGFTDKDQKDKEIRFDWTSEEGNVVITIANNGCPLKEGVSSDKILLGGFSTSLNQRAADGSVHTGLGGYEIYSLMEGLGKVEVLSLPEEEFPVVYKLVFEKTNFETIDLDI